MIVDDNRLFTEVIRQVLTDNGVEVAGTESTGTDGIAAAKRLRPDVVLIDLALPDQPGLDVGRSIMSELPGTRVVAVTGSFGERNVREALKSGFHGYLTKDMSLNEFVTSIRSALNGNTVTSTRLGSAVTGTMTEDRRSGLLLAGQLSPREKELLALLVDGASSSEIAEKLTLSPNTVRTHIQSILTKLQVHSRLEAAMFAVKYGVVRLPGRASR